MLLGLAGGLLMVVSEFLTLRSVSVVTASCSDLAQPAERSACVTSGHEEHAYAFVLLGVVAALMTWGAAFGRSRPAAIALIVIGAAVLAIAFVKDVPNVHRTGVIGDQFDSAKAVAGPGLWLEIAGGTLVLVAGAMASVARRRP